MPRRLLLVPRGVTSLGENEGQIISRLQSSSAAYSKSAAFSLDKSEKSGLISEESEKSGATISDLLHFTLDFGAGRATTPSAPCPQLLPDSTKADSILPQIPGSTEQDDQGDRVLAADDDMLDQPSTAFSPGAQRPQLSPALSTATRPVRPRLLAAPAAPVGPGTAEALPNYCYRVNFTREAHKKRRSYECGLLCVKAGKGAELFNEQGRHLMLGRTLRINEKLSPGAEVRAGACVLIEVEHDIPFEDFTNGRAFSAPSAPAAALAAAPVAAKKRFQPLADAAGNGGNQPAGSASSQAPPGALVLSGSGTIFLEPSLARQLRPHQAEGLRFMMSHLLADGGCILADSMGLGKTLQALCLLWVSFNRPAGSPLSKKAAVVCPSSLCGNWEAEVWKWLGPLRIRPSVVQGGSCANAAVKAIRTFLAAGGTGASDGRLLIISYNQLRSHADLLDNALDLLICDEGHRLKSSTTSTAKRLLALKCKRRILLTGTPLQNNLDEFYFCCSFVQPCALPPLPAFHRVFKRPIDRAQDKSASHDETSLGQARSTELARLTSAFILRRGPEILEALLPSRVELLLTVPLTSSQVENYRALCTLRSSSSVSEGQQLHLLLLLRQLCNDPEGLRCKLAGHGAAAPQLAGPMHAAASDDEDFPSDTDLTAVSWNGPAAPEAADSFIESCRKILGATPLQGTDASTSAKLHLLKTLLTWIHAEVPDDGVVIVSGFTTALACCQQLCTQLGFCTSALTGSTPAQKRVGLVNDFNKLKGPRVFLLSAKAGGVGLNIVGANRLVMLEPDWNPAVDLQAMGRVWRQGQTKPVCIYRLAALGTLEEKILQRQARKQGLATAMVDAAAIETDASSDWESLRQVYQLDGYTIDGLPLRSSSSMQNVTALPPEASTGAGINSAHVLEALHSVRLLALTGGAVIPAAEAEQCKRQRI